VGHSRGVLRDEMIWIVDARRDDGQRFVADADKVLTAFVELEAVIQEGTKRSCKPI
jgi:hypothetical protein